MKRERERERERERIILEEGTSNGRDRRSVLVRESAKLQGVVGRINKCPSPIAREKRRERDMTH